MGIRNDLNSTLLEGYVSEIIETNKDYYEFILNSESIVGKEVVKSSIPCRCNKKLGERLKNNDNVRIVGRLTSNYVVCNHIEIEGEER